MDHTAANSSKKIIEMLNKGPEYCLEEVARFSSLVDEFVVHSPRLSPQQSHFLDCLIQYKKEMVAHAAFIRLCKEALKQFFKRVTDLVKKIKSVEESMSTDEKSLAASCYEEKLIEDHEIQSRIQEHIINILTKGRTIQNYQSELKEMKNELNMLNERVAIVENLKKTIENLWTTATDAWNAI